MRPATGTRRRSALVAAWLLVCGLVACLSSASQVLAVQSVRVAAVTFPPYVLKQSADEAPKGLLVQVLEALNQRQADYHFEAVPTSLPRRFQDFSQGRVDLVLFENPQWGWQGISRDEVAMGLEDAEVFVARNVAGRNQGYFADLQGKRLALFNGYHYAFANFNADPEFLTRNYNAQLGYSHEANLSMVLRDRADIALVTRSYLRDYLQRNRADAGQFLVSNRTDQVYRHRVMLRPGSGISPQVFSELWEGLRRDGTLSAIFAPYAIEVKAGR